jgi:hypothetical protein
MSFVNHQHSNVGTNLTQNLLSEIVIGQSFGRNQQHIGLVTANFGFDLFPIMLVCTVDAHGRNPNPPSRLDLVSYQS